MPEFCMEAFADELVKIAVAAHLSKALGFAKAHPKALAYGGTATLGGAAALMGAQGIEDIRLGRRIRKQMEEAQAARG